MERSLVRALRNVQRDLYHCVQCSTLMFRSEDGAAAPHVEWRRPRSRRVIGRRSSERSSRSRWRRTYAGDEGGQCRDRAASAWAPASLPSLLLFPGVLLFGQPPTPCRFSQRSHAAMTMRAISPRSLGSLTNSGIVNAAVVPSSRTSGTVRCPVSGSNSKEPYVNQGDRSVRNTSDTCSGTRLTATDANRARGRRSRERSRWR